MLRWLTLALVACSAGEKPTAPVPTVALVLPAGPAADELRIAARVALEPTYAVTLIDEAAPRAIETIQGDPVVVAALAHLSAASVDAAAGRWRASDLPVITLAAGTKDLLPRLAPSPLEVARCAAGLSAGRVLLVHDGEAQGMERAASAQGALGDRVAEVLGLAPDTLSADAARVVQRRPQTVLYTGRLRQGGDLLRLLRPQGFTAAFLAVGDDPEILFSTAGGDAGDALVVTRDRAPFLREPLDRLTTALGKRPSGAARSVMDAATVLRAALDLSPRQGDAPPARADVARAFDQVIGVGVGGPLALVESRPSPVQCTAYGASGGAWTPMAAAQIGADGAISRLDLMADAGVEAAAPAPDPNRAQ